MTNPLWLIPLVLLSPLGAILIILLSKVLFEWNKIYSNNAGLPDSKLEALKWILSSIQFKSIFVLDERELEAQGPFWLSILIPLLYFFHLGYYVWKDYFFYLSGDGIKVFFEVSAFPLAILSLSVPASILISRMHASKQTAKQIKITEMKNNIDLYNSYRKNFVEHFENIEKVKFCEDLEVKFKLHNRIFKHFFVGLPINGIPSINVKEFENVENILTDSRKTLNSIVIGRKLHSIPESYLRFCNNIHILTDRFYINDLGKLAVEKGVLVPVNSNEIEKALTFGTTTEQAVAAYRCARDFFYHLCDYCGYESSLIYNKETGIIDMGKKYLKATDPLVIENLFKNEFMDCEPYTQGKN